MTAAAEADPRDERLFTVFVRFPDEKTAQRVTPDGRTTRRKAHAAMHARADAERVIELSKPYLDQHHPGSQMRIAPF